MARAKGTTRDAGASALEAARAQLRRAPPKTFTKERDALVRALKAQGHAEASAALKRTHRTSASVWAINTLATQDADPLRAVLKAGAQVRLAQRRALSGAGRTALRDASRAFSDAVQHALGRTRALLESAGEASGSAVMERVRQTLLASAEADEPTREVLAEGRLEEDLSPVGFGFTPALRVVEGGAGAGAREDERSAEDEKARKARLATEREAARRRAALARKEVARAQQAVKAAEAEQRRLEKVAQAAEARAAEARGRADEAAAAAGQRREALDAAKKRLEEADASGAET